MLNFIKNLFFPTQVGVSTVSDSSIFMLKLKESLVELRTNAEDNEASFIFYKNGVTAVINIFIRKLHSLNGVDVTDAMTAAANQDLAGKLKNFNSSRETYLEKIISIINELETTTAVEPNIVVGFPYVAAAIISIGVCFTVLAVIGGVFLIKNYYNPVIVKTDIQAKIEGLKNQIKIISEAKDSKITLLQEKKKRRRYRGWYNKGSFFRSRIN